MDLEILNVAFMMDSYIRQADKNEMKIICENLLKFSFEKSLLLDTPYDENGNFKTDFIVKESRLTEKGKQIFENICDKWLNYTDNKNSKIDKINNIKMLEKYYDKLLKDYESKK